MLPLPSLPLLLLPFDALFDDTHGRRLRLFFSCPFFEAAFVVAAAVNPGFFYHSFWLWFRVFTYDLSLFVLIINEPPINTVPIFGKLYINVPRRPPHGLDHPGSRRDNHNHPLHDAAAIAAAIAIAAAAAAP
jgi:hypothetical protein